VRFICISVEFLWWSS